MSSNNRGMSIGPSGQFSPCTKEQVTSRFSKQISLRRQRRNVSFAAEPIRKDQNALGGDLEVCCTNPMTGAFQDGFCRVRNSDTGVHAICAQMTQEFLDFTKARGNIIASMRPIEEGQRCCLSASRWKEATYAGKAPLVFLKATSVEALATISLADLKSYALDLDSNKPEEDLGARIPQDFDGAESELR